MCEGIIEGNQYGGQLLVKIDREKTKNLKDIKPTTILFNRKGEKGIDLMTQRKGELLELLNQEAMKNRDGKGFDNYEIQPQI